MSGVASQVDKYQRKAAHTYQSRWADTHAMLRTIAHGTVEVANAFDLLATALSNAEREWDSAHAEATNHGFTVVDRGAATTVSAPAASGGHHSDHHDHQAQLAQRLQTRLRNAASDAIDGRAACRRRVAEASTDGIKHFHAGPGSVAYPDTGDAGLDATLHAKAAELVGFHDDIAQKAKG